MTATTTKFDRVALVEAFKAARDAPLAADKGPDYDYGSCNFDTPVLKLKNVREQTVVNCALEAGVHVYARNWLGSRYFFVDVPLRGQGVRRTLMAEAATKRLKELGYKAYTYYQLD